MWLLLLFTNITSNRFDAAAKYIDLEKCRLPKMCRPRKVLGTYIGQCSEGVYSSSWFEKMDTGFEKCALRAWRATLKNWGANSSALKLQENICMSCVVVKSNRVEIGTHEQ